MQNSERNNKEQSIFDIDINKERARALEEKQEAYRGGYFNCMRDILDAMNKGVSLTQLTEYYNGALFNWRFATKHTFMEPPPKIYNSKKDNF